MCAVLNDVKCVVMNGKCAVLMIAAFSVPKTRLLTTDIFIILIFPYEHDIPYDIELKKFFFR
jgi:hypothetical protein